jgi:hypothetical protein
LIKSSEPYSSTKGTLREEVCSRLIKPTTQVYLGNVGLLTLGRDERPKRGENGWPRVQPEMKGYFCFYILKYILTYFNIRLQFSM